jgi:hypothetical protein
MRPEPNMLTTSSRLSHPLLKVSNYLITESAPAAGGLSIHDALGRKLFPRYLRQAYRQGNWAPSEEKNGDAGQTSSAGINCQSTDHHSQRAHHGTAGRATGAAATRR